jgi:prevent-host-death family protein
MRVPSTEAQNNFGKFLKYAEAGEEIIISRKGRDVAKIIPAAEMVHEEAMDYTLSANHVTYEQFLELTEASEQRYELIDGVLYFMASPAFKHQHAVHEIMGTFYYWFKGKSCKAMTSPFDITIKKTSDNICVVQPDVFVVCDTNVDNKGKYMGVPLLVVEILSPSTRTKDMIKKLNLYMVSGVREYWVIDPEDESVQVYAFENKEIQNNKVWTNRADSHAYSFYFEGLAVGLKDLFNWEGF